MEKNLILLGLGLVAGFSVLFFSCEDSQSPEPVKTELTDIISEISINQNLGQYIEGELPSSNSNTTPIIAGTHEIVKGGSLILRIQPSDSAKQIVVSLNKTGSDYLGLSFGELEKGYFLIDLENNFQLCKTNTIKKIVNRKKKCSNANLLLNSTINCQFNEDQETFLLVISFKNEDIINNFTLNIASLNDNKVSQFISHDVSVNFQASSSNTLQVSLNWVDLVDMDLHVETPNGEDIYYNNLTGQNGGTLDLDSNPACEYDYVNNENITWLTNEPAKGLYTIRVDLWSACDYSGSFPYVVTIRREGKSETLSGFFNSSDETFGNAFSGRIITTINLLDPNHITEVNLTAYTPISSIFSIKEIPDQTAESTGVGISVNYNNSNTNIVPLVVEVDPFPSSDEIEFIIRKNSERFKVWKNYLSKDILLSSQNEVTLELQNNQCVFYVENNIYGTCNIEILAKNKNTQSYIAYDKIKFFSFNSVVIGLGGEGLDGINTNPPIPGQGIYEIGKILYDTGYNVYLYDEDEVPTQYLNNNISNFIIDLVKNSNVTEIAIFGYSHGGGSTYDLASLIKSRLGSAQLEFTAYIDAIEQPYINFKSEVRRPPKTKFHINYFQSHPQLHGNRTTENGIADLECNVTTGEGLGEQSCYHNSELNHTSIDNDSHIINSIANELKNRVSK